MSYTVQELLDMAANDDTFDTIDGEDYFYANISDFTPDEQLRLVKAYRDAKAKITLKEYAACCKVRLGIK